MEFNVAVLAVYFIVEICHGKLLKGPVNTTNNVGERVILDCQTDLNFSVFWYFNEEEVFHGGRISLERSADFDIKINASRGEYNLVILSANVSYDGLYTCADDEGEGERLSALLTVIDPSIAVSTVETSTSQEQEMAANVGLLVIVIVIPAAIVIVVVVVVAILIWKYNQKQKKENKSCQVINVESVPLSRKEYDQTPYVKSLCESDGVLSKSRSQITISDAEENLSISGNNTTERSNEVETKTNHPITCCHQILSKQRVKPGNKTNVEEEKSSSKELSPSTITENDDLALEQNGNIIEKTDQMGALKTQ